MKFLAYSAALLAYSSIALANVYTVPFQNIQVPIASKIYVNYDFNPHKQTLVCTVNRDNGFMGLDSVQWEYKGVKYKNMLPVTLQDDTRYSGQLADPDGRLVIKNETGYDFRKPMLVSCEYRNMN